MFEFNNQQIQSFLDDGREKNRVFSRTGSGRSTVLHNKQPMILATALTYFFVSTDFFVQPKISHPRHNY
jgi:hypothetical protein